MCKLHEAAQQQLAAPKWLRLLRNRTCRPGISSQRRVNYLELSFSPIRLCCGLTVWLVGFMPLGFIYLQCAVVESSGKCRQVDGHNMAVHADLQLQRTSSLILRNADILGNASMRFRPFRTPHHFKFSLLLIFINVCQTNNLMATTLFNSILSCSSFHFSYTARLNLETIAHCWSHRNIHLLLW